MDICSALQPIITPTIRLLFYTGYEKRGNLDQVCELLSLTFDQVIDTRCFNTSIALDYLLSATNKILFSDKVEIAEISTKMVEINIFGVDEEDLPTGLSHIIHLINLNQEWLMMDSYVGCRVFRCQIIDIQELFSLLTQLQEEFNSTTWYLLTGCEERDTHQRVVIDYIVSDYSLDIRARFNYLLETVERGTHLGNVGDYDFLPVKEKESLLGYLAGLHLFT